MQKDRRRTGFRFSLVVVLFVNRDGHAVAVIPVLGHKQDVINGFYGLFAGLCGRAALAGWRLALRLRGIRLDGLPRLDGVFAGKDAALPKEGAVAFFPGLADQHLAVRVGGKLCVIVGHAGAAPRGEGEEEEEGEFFRRHFSGGQQGFQCDVVEGEEAKDRLLYEVVRAGRAGGYARYERTRRKPVFGYDFLFQPQIVVDYLVGRFQPAGVADEVGGHFFLAHLRQVGGVRAVVAAYDEQEIGFLGEHFAQGVLPFLRGAADGVEKAEIFPRAAVALGDGGVDAALHFLGLAAEHGCLVGDADGLQVHIGVEPGGMGAPEALQELGLVAAAADVVANVVGLIQRQDDEVMAVAVEYGAGARGFRFLVLGFAVNDGCGVFVGVLAHPLPDTHHVAAGGVDDLAAALLQLRERGDFRPERGDDDHVLGGEVVDLRLAPFADEVLDAERGNLLVDLRVVDDLAQDEEPAILENLARGVGQVDGPLDPVAEAELLRQLQGYPLEADDAPAGAQPLDDLAAVVRFNLRLHGGHDIRRAEVDPRLRGGCGRRRGHRFSYCG